MLVAWHPARWWNFCTPENDKKEMEQFLIDEQ